MRQTFRLNPIIIVQNFCGSDDNWILCNKWAQTVSLNSLSWRKNLVCLTNTRIEQFAKTILWLLINIKEEFFQIVYNAIGKLHIMVFGLLLRHKNCITYSQSFMLQILLNNSFVSIRVVPFNRRVCCLREPFVIICFASYFVNSFLPGRIKWSLFSY